MFYDNLNQGTSKEKLLEVIKGLKEYTIVHFSNAERYMKNLNYKDFSIHKAEHDKIVATIKDYEER
jgi:hemerythrin